MDLTTLFSTKANLSNVTVKSSQRTKLSKIKEQTQSIQAFFMPCLWELITEIPSILGCKMLLMMLQAIIYSGHGIKCSV